jgi:hypothetical protein
MDDYGLVEQRPLPEDLNARVRAELAEGERLVWVGQPNPARAVRSSYAAVVIGAIIMGIALFGSMAALTAGAAAGDFGVGFACFPICGLPVLLFGLFMLTSPIWVRRRAEQTCYALTNRRALTWVAGWFGRVDVRSYGPAQLQKLRRTEYGDGGGDLVFEEIVTRSTDTDGNWQTHRTQYGFLAIDNVRAVEELLRKTLL